MLPTPLSVLYDRSYTKLGVYMLQSAKDWLKGLRTRAFNTQTVRKTDEHLGHMEEHLIAIEALAHIATAECTAEEARLVAAEALRAIDASSMGTARAPLHLVKGGDNG
jgi:hypothetical protein